MLFGAETALAQGGWFFWDKVVLYPHWPWTHHNPPVSVLGLCQHALLVGILDQAKKCQHRAICDLLHCRWIVQIASPEASSGHSGSSWAPVFLAPPCLYSFCLSLMCVLNAEGLLLQGHLILPCGAPVLRLCCTGGSICNVNKYFLSSCQLGEREQRWDNRDKWGQWARSPDSASLYSHEVNERKGLALWT